LHISRGSNKTPSARLRDRHWPGGSLTTSPLLERLRIARDVVARDMVTAGQRQRILQAAAAAPARA